MQIIDKFYKDKKINNVFVAKDGINQENALVDSLSIGVLAAKENSPIMISNGSLVNSQKNLLKIKI